MSIAVTCKKCSARFSVKDSQAGKRIRCKECQAAVLVQSSEVSEDEVYDDQVAAPGLKKKGAKKKSKGLSLFQKFLIYAAQNPWVGMVLTFLFVWTPVGLIFPVPVMVVDGIIALLAVLLCILSIFAAMVGTAIQNPFEFFTTLTTVALAQQFVPPEHLAKAGRLIGKGTKAAGMKSLGDADTGGAGRMVAYTGGVTVVFLAHLTALLFWHVSWMK